MYKRIAIQEAKEYMQLMEAKGSVRNRLISLVGLGNWPLVYRSRPLANRVPPANVNRAGASLIHIAIIDYIYV
jgi:hypothetical protein